jgi:hypothetical protein
MRMDSSRLLAFSRERNETGLDDADHPSGGRLRMLETDRSERHNDPKGLVAQSITGLAALGRWKAATSGAQQSLLKVLLDGVRPQPHEEERVGEVPPLDYSALGS